MKRKNLFFNSLSTRVIGTIILFILIISVVIEMIGYYFFTYNFTIEYNNSAYRAAVAARTYVYSENFKKYLELADENGNIQGDEELRAEYLESKQDLVWLCNAEDMSVIYVIIPDDDFNNYTSILNCLNYNSKFTPWNLGDKKQTSPEYKESYMRLMSGLSKRESVTRLENLNGGDPHVTSLIPLEGANGEIRGILCAQRLMTDMVQMRRSYFIGVAIVTLFILAIFILIEWVMIRGQLIKPLKEVTTEAERFATENERNEKYKPKYISSINELKALAYSIEKMEIDTLDNIEKITDYTKEKQRMGTELELASQIQMGMLPSSEKFMSDNGKYDIFATMTPAKAVGGDFFDIFNVDDDHLVFLVADVSDKGIGAAFFMAIAKTLIKSRAIMGGTASEILEYTDRLISEKNAAQMFVTVWLAIVDLNTGHVDACNAGHDYPAVMLDGKDYVVEKTIHGSPVCFLPGMPFPAYSYDLKPGDSIFLYTDGLNEAVNSEGERFGIDRVINVLNENKKESCRSLLDKMKESVEEFMGDEPQFDDMTMLAFTYKGN